MNENSAQNWEGEEEAPNASNWAIPSVSKGAAPLNVVLFQPEIAANVGAVGRTCVGLGAKLWLVRPLGFQILDRRLKRAGLDYWPKLDWDVVDDWADLLQKTAAARGGDASDGDFYFFSKTATRRYSDVEFRRGDVFVFGPESRGLPPSLLEGREERALRIPIRPQIRSLNLSASVAVAAFEARRQLDF